MNNKNFLTIEDSEIIVFDELAYLSLCRAYGLSERDKNEMKQRGWLGYTYLVDSSGQNYWPLEFYDSVRIAQDTEMMGYTGGHGLIVVQEVTLKYIINTCRILLKEGFFKYYKPLTRKEILILYRCPGYETLSSK